MQEEYSVRKPIKGVCREDEFNAAIRRVLIHRLPLEDVWEYVDIPVYGLTEEVYGMQKIRHSVVSRNFMRLDYYSPRYGKHPNVNNEPNFRISTSIEPEISPQRRANVFPSFCLSLLARAMYRDLTREERCYKYPCTAKDVAVVIDGKPFNGKVLYRTAPVCHTGFVLYHGDLAVQGEALGPSIEELIQILQSLYDLKGKAVESSR
jgi:hypothetical protein